MYTISKDVYEAVFPTSPKIVFESHDLCRINEERIYLDCVDTVVEDKDHK